LDDQRREFAHANDRGNQGIFEGPAKERFQRLARRISAHVEGFCRRQQLAAADVVVEEKAEPDQPGRPQALGIGEHEAHRPDDVRRVLPEDFAFHQGFANQPELVMLEIAKSAMDELGRIGRGAARQIVHLGEENGISPTNRVPGNAATVDAATDDKDVMDWSSFQQDLRALSQCSIFLQFRRHFGIISK
jgi:hypothetical protein